MSRDPVSDGVLLNATGSASLSDVELTSDREMFDDELHAVSGGQIPEFMTRKPTTFDRALAKFRPK